MTCAKRHDYTVENEAQTEVRYSGADEDEAVSALVALRAQDECGQVIARHADDGGFVDCDEESSRIEDEAIKAWDHHDRSWQNAYEAFHGEGPYAIEDQG